MRTLILGLMVFGLVVGCDGGGGTSPGADTAQDVATDTGQPDAPAEDVVLLDVVGETGSDTGPDAALDVAPDVPPPALHWGTCDTSEFSGSYPLPGSNVKCAKIPVPWDHDDPGGPTVTLVLARQPAVGVEDPEAIFFLAGGPGGSAVEQAGIMPMLMEDLPGAFDLIYVDQRGTGSSTYLGCSVGYPYDGPEWTACAGEFEDLDRSHLLTRDAARDLDYVRKYLGYPRLNARGGSYGTRMGLEYLRQFPQTAGMMILDGAAPPDMDLFGTQVDAPDVGVAWIVEECAAEPECLAVSPDLAGDLVARRAALVEEPHGILVGGQVYAEDESLYLEVLASALYAAQTRYRVPRAIHNAVSGDNTAWNQLMSSLFGVTITDAGRTTGPLIPYRPENVRPPPLLGESPISPVTHAIIACTEWFPVTGGMDALQAKINGAEWATVGTLDLAETCDLWGIPFDEALLAPVAYDGSVLLLSGEYDLNTFPALADKAAETLPLGTHLVVPHATHSVLTTKCGAGITEGYFLNGGGGKSRGDIRPCCARVFPPNLRVVCFVIPLYFETTRYIFSKQCHGTKELHCSLLGASYPARL